MGGSFCPIQQQKHRNAVTMAEKCRYGLSQGPTIEKTSDSVMEDTHHWLLVAYLGPLSSVMVDLGSFSVAAMLQCIVTERELVVVAAV